MASNIRLSFSDIKLAFSGMGCVILPFLLVNLVALLLGSAGEELLPVTAVSLGAVYSVFTLALVMAVIGFVLVLLVSALWLRINRRHF